jgi:hypothetical protein
MKKLIITENEKFHIKKLYNLITEDPIDPSGSTIDVSNLYPNFKQTYPPVSSTRVDQSYIPNKMGVERNYAIGNEEKASEFPETIRKNKLRLAGRTELIIQGGGNDPYEYRKEYEIENPKNAKYYTKLKTGLNWFDLTNDPLNEYRIATVIFKDIMEKPPIYGGKLTQQEYLLFYNRMLPLLERAKTFWRNWLNLPETRIKFKKLNDLYWDTIINLIFEKYLTRIDDLKIVIYSEYVDTELPGKGGRVINYEINGYKSNGCLSAYACTYPYDKNQNNIINLNVSLADDKTDDGWYGTIVHEIQHILYGIKPLTPNKNITQFKSTDDCYRKNRLAYEDVKLNMNSKFLALNLTDEKLKSIASDIGLDFEKTKQIIESILKAGYNDFEHDYFQTDHSEFNSRVFGIRTFLLDKNKDGIPDSPYVSKNNFVDYIKNFKSSNDGNIKYIMGHWAAKGFPPVQQFLDEFNALAKNEEKNKGKLPFEWYPNEKYKPQQPNKIDPNMVG